MNAPVIQTKVVTIPYLPRPAFMPFHQRTQRWGAMICHRRAGKTVAAINDLQRKCIECSRLHPRFAFIAPTRVRVKDIGWQYLKWYSEPIPGRKVNESELYVEYPNGGRVTLYGADTDRAMGLYLDGVVLDECDEIGAALMDTIRPTLADREGWAVWMGILKGRHNLWRRYEDHKGDPQWFSMMLRASESAILPGDELVSMRREMGESAYAMQMECDVNASIEGSIYGREMDGLRRAGRIYNLPFDPSAPLYTFWDLGYSDYTPIWLVQLVGRDVCVLDYFCRHREIPAFYAAKVAQWENDYHAPVMMNFLPHDAASHEKTGRTYLTELKAAGLERLKVVPRTPDQWLGINMLRSLLPRCYLHATNCSVGWKQGEIQMPSGLDCLDYYACKPDASTGIIRDVPIHDQYSHGADALRTFAEAYRLGLIEGTSATAGDSQRRSHPVRAIKAGYRR